MNLQQAKILDLPIVLDDRGNLSFFQNSDQIPFTIKRVYWIYDVPGGEQRGGHAYKNSQEVIIALSGSFDIILNNGREEQKFTLNRSYYGLYVPSMMWRHIENFSTNALAFIATDSLYDLNEYIRDIDNFKKVVDDKSS